jgi:4-amino-4-deoxychorismate lyase
MSTTVLLNGEENHLIDIRDRGFQYGDGVFTTLLVIQGTPLFLDRHLRRLARDCRRLAIPFPGEDLLRQETARLLQPAPAAAVLKIHLTRGIGGRGYTYSPDLTPTRVLTLNPAPEYPADIIEQGIRVTVCNTRLGINPALAGIKHTNRLEQILARAELQKTGYMEGILLDQQGYVTEGTMTNLFMVKDTLIKTPKIDKAGVSGVMREIIMEYLNQSGYKIRETRLKPQELQQADELFLTNSVIGVWPVKSCAEKDYPSLTIAQHAHQYLRHQYLFSPP